MVRNGLMAVAIFVATTNGADAQMSTPNDPARLAVKMLGKEFPLTQSYLNKDAGNPTPGQLHAGLDYGAIRDSKGKITTPIDGQPVRAVKGGTVIYAGGDYGTVAIFDGTNTTIYLHLKNIRVVADTISVATGGVIGYVGSKGATAPHCHVEVRKGKQKFAVGPSSGTSTAALTIDPFYYLLK